MRLAAPNSLPARPLALPRPHAAGFLMCIAGCAAGGRVHKKPRRRVRDRLTHVLHKPSGVRRFWWPGAEGCCRERWARERPRRSGTGLPPSYHAPPVAKRPHHLRVIPCAAMMPPRRLPPCAGGAGHRGGVYRRGFVTGRAPAGTYAAEGSCGQATREGGPRGALTSVRCRRGAHGRGAARVDLPGGPVLDVRAPRSASAHGRRPPPARGTRTVAFARPRA